MALAMQREKRQNAGSKMFKLLDAEEEDDFYKTTYGGFTEEGDDNDYQSEGSGDDVIDSDFDIDETEEVKSGSDDEGKPKRKRKGIDTKAYKEPVKAKTEKLAKPKKKKPKVECSSVQIYQGPAGKKSLRQTTSSRTREVEDRKKEREAKEQMMKDIAKRRNVSEVRRLTQEELLEEAKITEEHNLRSLEIYHRMELEKKRARSQKQTYKGPMVRYHSLTMPLIEEYQTETDINVETSDNGQSEGGDIQQPHYSSSEKCSRTFITFTDERHYKDTFTQQRVRPPIRQYCPVTRQPAKYFDPITKSPFANATAFRLIRDSYSQQLQEGVPTERRTARKSMQPPHQPSQKSVERV